MLYMTGDNLTIIVLERGNVDELVEGHPCHSPDKKVLIAYTPDMPWLVEQIQKTDGAKLDIAKLIDAGRNRPHVPTPKTTGYKRFDFIQ